ncbi:dTMP kinase [Adhaeretor mobilis]|uniref:Thymidylate kinase n=1 Tax=Adhaeretor mobilis TaxID=1930276 RepID=A0A517MRC5_9BACT|nr:dTMP kinase [Adhaeretor mobilis]QDS97432.1 Thymidylate kinase [Adhaeretor mobilis]
MFFSFDGIDGVGKTTQIEQFCDWVRGIEGEGTDREVVFCRDPGTTALGEQLREILLNSDEQTAISARSEMLVYMAARAQLVEEIIKPALKDGKTVVSDRFLLANIVYQGYAGGLEVEAVRTVGQVATAGISPDCTFLLDMDPAAALERMGTELDRVESRGDAYRKELRKGFLSEAQSMGDSVHVIDASRDIETIQQEIRAIAKQLL